MVFMLSTNIVLGTPPMASEHSVKNDNNILCDLEIDKRYTLKREYDKSNTKTLTYKTSPYLVIYFMISFQSNWPCSAAGISFRIISLFDFLPLLVPKYIWISSFFYMYSMILIMEHSNP